MPTEVIENASAVIESLDHMWSADPPRTYLNKVMQRFMDTAHDQETVGDNPYWDIVRRLPLDRWGDVGDGHAVQVDGYSCRVGRDYIVSRERLAKTYAWAIPTPGDVAWIKSQLDGRGVVEIGAGTGYWAWQLSQAEMDVLAFDIAPLGNHWCGTTQYHPVFEGGPEQASEFPTRALMLSWPPHARRWQPSRCTPIPATRCSTSASRAAATRATTTFSSSCKTNGPTRGSSPKHVTYGGIHCYVELYRRKDGSQ